MRKGNKLSRSKIDLFVECQRCFYLSERLKVKRPSIPAFTLNSATDHLLKKEFDIYRKKQTPHPLMVENRVAAVPFDHPELETWRYNFTGVQHFFEPIGYLIFGAVDDIWKDTTDGTLMVVDYKSTSIEGPVTLEGKWKEGYKRQMEVYQWLLRRNGFPVNNRGYFVYVNAQKNRDAFNGRLEFDISLLSYDGSDAWVEPTLHAIHEVLDSPHIPPAGDECEYCAYRDAAGNGFKTHLMNLQKTEKSHAQKS